MVTSRRIYMHRDLPAAVTHRAPRPRPSRWAPRSWPNRTAMPAPARPAADRGGITPAPLAVVFTGLPGGDLVLPVRLAQGAGRGRTCHHFLADPAVWHKIDLVRVRDRKAPGGWRYYAHLLTHQAGYQSPSTQARRAATPTGRRAGVDANVSNLALASFPAAHPERLAIDQICRAHCPAARCDARSQAGPGPSACPGSLPTQHQC